MFKFYITVFLSIFLFTFEANCNENNDENKTFQTVQGSLDIPLAKGLEVKNDNIINFDSLNGTILSISYETKIRLTKIKDFYLKTLPQMGWEIIANEFLDNTDIVYLKRDDEALEIEFSTREELKTVKFFGKLDS